MLLLLRKKLQDKIKVSTINTQVKLTRILLSLDQLKNKTKILLVSNIFPRDCVPINYGECPDAWQRDQAIQSERRFHPQHRHQHRATPVYLEVLGSSVSLSQSLWRWWGKRVHSPASLGHGHPTVWKHNMNMCFHLEIRLLLNHTASRTTITLTALHSYTRFPSNAANTNTFRGPAFR